MTYGNPGPGLGQAQSGRVKPVNGFIPISTYINMPWLFQFQRKWINY